jgi:transposase
MSLLYLTREADSGELKLLSAKSSNNFQALRYLAIACIADGMSNIQCAEHLSISYESVRKFVHLYNFSGARGLRICKSRGRTSKFTADDLDTLCRLLDSGPDFESHKCERWTIASLSSAFERKIDKSCSTSSVQRLVKRLGYRLLMPRPRHRKSDPEAQEAFKKNANDSEAIP